MQKTTTDLRQVWFPGAHANVGGGYSDQEIANITLAWYVKIDGLKLTLSNVS
jgi:hypothetical protein